MRNFNKIARNKISDAVKEISEKYNIEREVIEGELQRFLSINGRLKTSDRVLDVLHNLGLTAFDIYELGKMSPDGPLVLEEIVAKQEQEKTILKEKFRKKYGEEIPLPQDLKDLDKIPPLREFPPDVFENFIIKISDNLDKVSLDTLGILVPEIIEVMSPPTKLPPSTAVKLLGYVGKIVEWENMFHSTRTTLEKYENN